MTNELYKILNRVVGKAIQPLPSRIAGIKINSKEVQPGDVFVAICGAQVDGHNFIPEAIQRGAALIVVEKPQTGLSVPQLIVADTKAALSRMAANYYGDPTASLKIIGVTGTNGKTTTVYLLNAIFQAAGLKRGTVGTLGYSLEDQFTPTNLTTPDCTQLQAVFAQMLAHGIELVAMEVSSHALALSRVADINFLGGVFTNISQDHLDFHQTLDNYARTKAQLFAMVNPAGFLVYNREDHYASLFQMAAKAPIFSFALEQPADYTWLPGMTYQYGIQGQVQTPRGPLTINSRLSGIHNLKNILAAVAVADRLAIAPEAIQAGIAAVSHVPGRLEEITQPGRARVFIDFAHTPDAIRNVLSVLTGLKSPRGKLIVVFGCGGNRDRKKRPLMAQAVGERADWAVLTSDNPRNEDPNLIIEEAGVGFPSQFTYHKIVDRREAIHFALSQAGPEDIVAILGKGHEDYQEIRGQKFPFSDRAVVLEYWRATHA